MENKKRGFESKIIRYAPKEYKELITALENNDSERVKDIVFKIFYRGDL